MVEFSFLCAIACRVEFIPEVNCAASVSGLVQYKHVPVRAVGGGPFFAAGVAALFASLGAAIGPSAFVADASVGDRLDAP
jgi:hypothetical protein